MFHRLRRACFHPPSKLGGIQQAFLIKRYNNRWPYPGHDPYNGMSHANKKQTEWPRNTAFVLLLFVYLAGIFVFSSTPGPKSHSHNWFTFSMTIKDIFHVPAFAILFLLMYKTLKAWGFLSRKSCYLYASVAASLYGVFLEVYQACTPGRFASPTDIFFNLIGVFFGIVILWLPSKSREWIS